MSATHRPPPIYVGCAGWNLPAAQKHRFPPEGSHLVRYAARLPGSEINSSFHRPHRASTYAKWAASVPDHFRFSVKLPKTITHVHRLVDAKEPLLSFIGAVAELGEKLGALLVQLPPSLKFEPRIAKRFFALLRRHYKGLVFLEPRHPTWFTTESEKLLAVFRIGRVAADPAPVAAAGKPGGWPKAAYFRLHGSPRMYYSKYSAAYVAELAARLKKIAAAGRPAWCIFDNTASGAATINAMNLMKLLQTDQVRRRKARRRT